MYVFLASSSSALPATTLLNAEKILQTVTLWLNKNQAVSFPLSFYTLINFRYSKEQTIKTLDTTLESYPQDISLNSLPT